MMFWPVIIGLAVLGPLLCAIWWTGVDDDPLDDVAHDFRRPGRRRVPIELVAAMFFVFGVGLGFMLGIS